MIYARIKSGEPLGYIAADKTYAVAQETECGRGFYITADNGKSTLCLWSGCAHLDFGDWERIEIPDEGEAE